MQPEPRLRYPALGVAALVLAAACSGVGVRRAVNPYAQICSDEKAYLEAVNSGDAAATREAEAQMEADIKLIPERQVRASQLAVVNAASKGDLTPIRQDYRANCLPLPSPSPTTPGVSSSSG